MKASSGINALAPEQSDSAEAFREDTMRSGGGLSVPELVDTLVVRPGQGRAGQAAQGEQGRAGSACCSGSVGALLAAACSHAAAGVGPSRSSTTHRLLSAPPAAQADSRDAVGWLEGQGIDLSGLVQLGGHSKKRTHTSSRGPVGFSIMKARGRAAAAATLVFTRLRLTAAPRLAVQLAHLESIGMAAALGALHSALADVPLLPWPCRRCWTGRRSSSASKSSPAPT